MAFPSIKSKIGTGAKILVTGETRTPDELVTEEFRSVKERVEAHSSQTVGQVVISVPAGYSSSRRAALRDAALKAGFADAHLLNDSIAAVIDYTDQSKRPATLLVYSMGYAGFEIGLVRAVRGHYRALSYEAGDSPCGASLDELILRAWLTALAERSLVLDPHPKQWGAAQWMEMRLAAQQVKEALSTTNEVVFPIKIQIRGSSQPLSFHFLRPQFEEAIAPSVSATLDLAEKMLKEKNLSPEDLDAVLLIGGSTHIPLVPALIEKRLGKKPVSLETDALAKGAALYAMRLERMPLTTTALGEEVSEPSEMAKIPADESKIVATVTTSEVEPTQPLSEATLAAVPSSGRQVIPAIPQQDATVTGREMVLRQARRLIEQGEYRQAELFLRGLIEDAEKLLDSIRSRPQPTTPQDAEQAISKAYQLLKQGRYEQAIAQSHLAWKLAPDSPDIFDQMIDIHCQAAMAKTKIEDYALSCRWLECAYNYDQSNTKVQQLLAERHYIQAKQLAQRGRRKEALKAIDRCLYWNPEHKEGNQLKNALSAS
jgi:hypothetical protein